MLAPTAVTASIVGPDAHYYGPLNQWYGVGYKDSVEKDGAWRIVSNSRRIDGERHALNVALYRAAELARDAGFSYVQILGGYSMRTRGVGVLAGNESAKIFARGANGSDALVGCRSTRPGECYAVPVDQLLAVLGPAVGRSGGRAPIVAPLPPKAPPQRFVPGQPTPAQILNSRLKAAQSAHGRNPAQGWTVSD
ncbi:hypothetical protein AB5I39_15800 [Sphingomonas sp. MMS24-J45]|uniref:hypothetical protein n=1 Tax=Sphingomonas sp. MMS24-J45 TaxID=3238806 RepID=UPI003851362E